VFKTWMLATRASMTNWINVMFMGSGLGPAACPGMTVEFPVPPAWAPPPENHTKHLPLLSYNPLA
jgi:hypothetical protein